MNKSLAVSKKCSLPESKQRNPSINMKIEDSNLFKTTANIDLSKFLKTDECKQNQWLNKLNDKPLLELITDNLPETNMAPVNETELNCYQRLKKLLSMQNGTKYDEKQSEQHESMLEDVAVLEDRLNKLQSKYKENYSCKRLRSNKNLKAYALSNSSSFYDRHNKVMNFSMNTTQKSIILGKAQTSEMKKKSLKPTQRKTAINFSIKDQIAEFKASCCEKFINYKKEVNQKIYSEIEEFIETAIHDKMENVVKSKINELHSTRQENNNFKMILLEKELQIQMLKKELKLKEEKLIDNLDQDQQFETFSPRKNVQQFYEEYHATFGDMALESLKKKLDYMENLYFNKYSKNQATNLDKFTSLKLQKQELERKLKDKEEEFLQKQRDLNSVILQIRKTKMLDNSQETHEVFNKIPDYKKKCVELQNLQKFIFNKFIQWKNSRSDLETKIVQLISAQTVQNYEEMIEIMLEFNRHFATQEKSIEYMTKILSSVQKLKKIISPSKCYEKLEPLKVLEQVETILKNPPRRREKKLRTIYRQRTEAEAEYMKQN